MRLIAAGWSPTAAIIAFGILVGMTLPLLTIPQTVISSLSTALVPELSSAHQNRNTEAITRQIQNSLKFTLFINFLLLPAFIALGEGIGTFLYDNTTSGALLSQYAWCMIPISLSQITNAILNSLGAETKAMKNYFLGSIVLFVCIWFLPSVVGISALVIGMGACMGIASFLNLLLINKLIKPKKLDSILPFAKGVTHESGFGGFVTGGVVSAVVSDILIFTIISVPAILFGIFTQGILQHMFPLFFSLALSGALTMAAFLLLCHLFNVVNISQIISKRKNKNQPR